MSSARPLYSGQEVSFLDAHGFFHMATLSVMALHHEWGFLHYRETGSICSPTIFVSLKSRGRDNARSFSFRIQDSISSLGNANPDDGRCERARPYGAVALRVLCSTRSTPRPKGLCQRMEALSVRPNVCGSRPGGIEQPSPASLHKQWEVNLFQSDSRRAPRCQCTRQIGI